MLAACVIVAATTAFAQFKDNGGKAGTADTSAVGQAAEFANVTTTFDGVEFRLLRLIRDPKDKAKLRIVGQLVNTGDSDRWIFFIAPYPRLVDELGNVYALSRSDDQQSDIIAGVAPCINRYNWTNDAAYCVMDRDSSSTRLGSNAPVNIMVGFEPMTDGRYDASLASMATFANLSLHFAMTAKTALDINGLQNDQDYNAARAAMSVNDIEISQIPMPTQ